MVNKQKGAVYLLRDKFQIYIPGMRSVLEFRFVPEIIRDLDVYNREAFTNMVKEFIVNAKLPLSNLIIAIGDSAAIIKDFTSVPNPPTASQPNQQPPKSVPVSMGELEKQADVFLSAVPFEEFISNTFPIKNGIRVYAINKDVYETLRVAFESQGFSVVAILPAVAYGPEVSSKSVLDSAVASAIFQKTEALKQFNLINQSVFSLESEVVEEKESAASAANLSKKRLSVLIGVFVILVLILLIFAYIQFKPTPKMPQLPISTPASVVLPTAQIPSAQSLTPADSTTASVSAAATKDLTVQIISASGSEATTQTLKDLLNGFGFKSVTFTKQNSISTANSLITFSQNPTPAIKNAVIDAVKKISTNPTVQEKTGTQFDISIILGK